MRPDSRSSGSGPTPGSASRSAFSSQAEGAPPEGAPLVGVTYSLDRNGAGALIDEPGAYVAALERGGARAEALDPDPARLEAYLARLDGVLLAGGLDVDPARYGGRTDPSVDAPNPARDALELRLAAAARARGLPLLGICRGLQVANVACGGTLIEDLPAELGGAAPIAHRVRDVSGAERAGYVPGHVVRIAERSALGVLVGTARVPTNSLHHQAVRRVGAGLVPVGWTDDGIVEACEAAFAHPFFVAVQWHPELLPAGDAPARRLFEGFVAAARAYSAARGALERA